MQHISKNQIPANATLVDIRDDLERSQNPIEALGVVLPIALAELEDGNPELPDTSLVVVCSHGRRSEYAAALLEALGATKVYVLEGGIGG